MNNKKINFNKMFEDPIKNNYDFITNNIDEKIIEFIDLKFKETDIDLNEINDLSNQIIEERNQINNSYKKNNIGAKRFWNGLIFVLFFILIGFLFWSIYSNNKKVIKNYNEFEQEKLTIINELISKRHNSFLQAFSTTTILELYKYIFHSLGVKIEPCYNYEMFHSISTTEGFLEFSNGYKGIYKNSLFYDFVVKYLNYENIVTSETMSFPYTTTETYYSDGGLETRTVTEYETLTAYHTEPTPMIDSKNFLIFKTNFLKDLIVRNNLQKIDKKKYLVENVQFCKTVKIGSDSNDPSQILNFFTIKAQEDYLNWYNKKNNNVHDFVKVQDNFIVENNDVLLDDFSQFGDLKSITKYIKKEEDASLENIISSINIDVFRFFERWASMIQLPILIPGISREWYREDGKYLIGNEVDNYFIDLNKNNNSNLNLLNKFSNNHFRKIDNYFLKRDTWFEIENNDINKSILNSKLHLYSLNSFYSKYEIDYVTVYGFHVGAQIIPVQYERFYPVKKTIFFGNFYIKNNMNEKYVIGSCMKNMINNNLYKSEYLKKDVLEHNIWTNNPKYFEIDSEFKNDILYIAKDIQKIKNMYSNEITLTIDQNGISMFVDNVEKFDKEMHHKLNSSLEKYGEILSRKVK